MRFQNDGYLSHMVLLAEVKSVADAAKAEALLLAGKPGGALKEYGTGVTGMFAGPPSHAELQQEAITEPPGVYVIACAMNAEDGRAHPSSPASSRATDPASSCAQAAKAAPANRTLGHPPASTRPSSRSRFRALQAIPNWS